MEGVTILNVIEIAITTWGWSWWGAAGVFIGIAIIIIPLIVDRDDGCFVAFGALFGSFAIFIGIITFNSGTELPPIIQYQVTIDDTVSLKEFNEKYIIIEQEGLIYTVQEREVNEND